MFEFKKLSGSEITPYLDDIAKLRITVFKEFPYLYEGNLNYEKKYLQRYIDSEKSLILLALVEDKIIGATTCIPLYDEDEEFKQPLFQSGFDPKRTMYFGESIILKECRGKKLGHTFFKEREKYAKNAIKDLTTTCFCAVIRDENHKLRPHTYTPLNRFWQRMGYVEINDLVAKLSWKDIDHKSETEKELIFWTKSWMS